jgi:hypothetical protein
VRFYKEILHTFSVYLTKVLNIAGFGSANRGEFTAANFIFNFADIYTKEQII